MSKLLKYMNRLYRHVMVLSMIIVISYAGFALWDNGQVYAAAGVASAEMQGEKNELTGTEEESELLSLFRQFWDINPDICGWIEMDNTAIDYPILQGVNNMTYINSDPAGNFSISGSIYLDSRNERDYLDPYSLLYGHNMEQHLMFGDVLLYEDENFFFENQSGTLYLPDGEHPLITLALILTESGDSILMNPNSWKNSDVQETLYKALLRAVWKNQPAIDAYTEKLQNGKDTCILALSTCSYSYTDARTILLTWIDPEME